MYIHAFNKIRMHTYTCTYGHTCYCIAFHRVALRKITLHHITLHNNILHCIVLHCHDIALYCITYIASRCNATNSLHTYPALPLHGIPLCYLHYTTLRYHFIARQHRTLLYNAFHMHACTHIQIYKNRHM